MNAAKIKVKAVVLLIVIATILIVVILVGILLNFMTSQRRLTGHQLGRIQAYYASLAGINYALDRLTSGVWTVPTAPPFYFRAICRESIGSTPQGVACDFVDGNFPNSIPYILIAVAANGTPAFSVGSSPNNVNFPLCATSSSTCIYAYTIYPTHLEPLNFQ